MDFSNILHSLLDYKTQYFDSITEFLQNCNLTNDKFLTYLVVISKV